MYDPIAWGNLSGEAVEDLLATLISRERPHVNHIRPSSGDHGRDLEVKNEDGSIDVYQIKKFYSNLTKGRKRQIEASWDRLNEYIQDFRSKGDPLVSHNALESYSGESGMVS